MFVIQILVKTGRKASWSSSSFQGGRGGLGLTGKGQDRDKIGTRQGQNMVFLSLKKV